MQATAKGEKDMSYHVIDKKIKTFSYRRDGEEVVDTPMGKKNTIRLIQTDTGKRKVHYWLCPELNYIPVRIEQFKNDKSNLIMTLDSLKWT